MKTPVDAPYQSSLSPIELYMAGIRHLGSYSLREAVEDYLFHHPEAVEGDVHAQIEVGITHYR